MGGMRIARAHAAAAELRPRGEWVHRGCMAARGCVSAWGSSRNEVVLDEADGEARLSHAARAEDDHLGVVPVRGRGHPRSRSQLENDVDKDAEQPTSSRASLRYAHRIGVKTPWGRLRIIIVDRLRSVCVSCFGVINIIIIIVLSTAKTRDQNGTQRIRYSSKNGE